MNLRQYARTVLALVAVFALLAGGAGISTAAQGSGSLTVLDWAGFDAEDFWIDFKNDNPDVNVTFEIGASDADIFAKMMAGSQADVFHPYTGWLQFYVDEGLVEEIDTSRLTNWDKIPDRFKELGQFDGKQYFIPYDWGYSSILYRTDLAPDAGESWNAMFDPKYSGHISMWDDGVAAVDVASYAHGWDELKLTDEQLEQIKQDWVAQREHNLFYWSGEPELVEAMASGDVWVAYAWQGAYALLRAQDVPVAYANPEGGSQLLGRVLRHPQGNREPRQCLCLPRWQDGGRDRAQRRRTVLLRYRQPGRHGRDHRSRADRGAGAQRSDGARSHPLHAKPHRRAAGRLGRDVGRRQSLVAPPQSRS